jgi:hypothetical protein
LGDFWAVGIDITMCFFLLIAGIDELNFLGIEGMGV